MSYINFQVSNGVLRLRAVKLLGVYLFHNLQLYFIISINLLSAHRHFWYIDQVSQYVLNCYRLAATF